MSSRAVVSVDVALRRGRFDLQIRFEADAAAGVRLDGPSGAGKSTLLRLLAGLDRPDSGRVTFADEVWFDGAARGFPPPHARGAVMAFQDARLFPHLTIAQHRALIEVASKRRPMGPSARPDLSERLDITPLMEARPADLSGGERQRAALALALWARPRLLLLDEPFSAQDAARRARCAGLVLEGLNEGRYALVLAGHGEDALTAGLAHRLTMTEGRLATAADPP